MILVSSQVFLIGILRARNKKCANYSTDDLRKKHKDYHNVIHDLIIIDYLVYCTNHNYLVFLQKIFKKDK